MKAAKYRGRGAALKMQSRQCEANCSDQNGFDEEQGDVEVMDVNCCSYEANTSR
jgi:hypothetical protein